MRTALTPDMTFDQRNERGCDQGPLLEGYNLENNYVGLWILTDKLGTFYMIEVDQLAEDGASASCRRSCRP